MQVAHIVSAAFSSRTRLRFDLDATPGYACRITHDALVDHWRCVQVYLVCIHKGRCKDKQNMEF